MPTCLPFVLLIIAPTQAVAAELIYERSRLLEESDRFWNSLVAVNNFLKDNTDTTANGRGSMDSDDGGVHSILDGYVSTFLTLLSNHKTCLFDCSVCYFVIGGD